jgi:hypothetical protein
VLQQLLDLTPIMRIVPGLINVATHRQNTKINLRTAAPIWKRWTKLCAETFYEINILYPLLRGRTFLFVFPFKWNNLSALKTKKILKYLTLRKQVAIQRNLKNFIIY